ncbi:MAG: hypothetical protein FRX49_05433 [Trebouxia sp. A1-2]|nr:MAG: hypothetical protein FRX49_05433 [Trebouxia sp. A1-2]
MFCCEARPAVDLPEPPTLNNAGRELKQDDNPPGPAQAGADASVPSNEPTGVQACNVPQEIMSDYEAKLTAGYSQTYSKGTNAGVTVSVEDGQHGTVTAGTLVHHALGWWDVQLVAPYDGCTEYRVDNVAADLIAPSSDPNYVSDFGVEVKPCGYPLLSGALN